MSQRELHFKSLLEVSNLIKDGSISSTEITKYLLERIDNLDHQFNFSFKHVSKEYALQRAQLLDAELKNGQWRGPLHGVPVAVKDLCFTTFAPTSGGGVLNNDFISDYNATVVEKLETAGAVILGKLSMTEGAYTSHHPDIPYPLNTWNKDYWVGSSSTGSGVATSLGLCFATLGSDTGGSIRLPCATCGLSGIKPTWGRVSRYGILPLADSLDHIGPMARSVADAAIILQTISGYDEKDTTSIFTDTPSYQDELNKNIHGIKIGIDYDYAFSNIDENNKSNLLKAIEIFKSLGARIIPVKFPDYEEAVTAWNLLCAVETAHAHRDSYTANTAVYGPALAQHIELGLNTSGLEVANGFIKRLEFSGALTTMFEDIDCLIIPTLPLPVPSLSQMDEYGKDPSVLKSIIKFTAPFDLSGTPTVTLPNGFDMNGLLTSMQLAGPKLSEGILIRVGHAYQTVTDWHLKSPTAL